MPWASLMECSSPSGCFSAHASSRPKMPLAVAWVGRPKKMPPSPPCLAKISAAPSAASVLPTPICASRMKIPGSCVRLTASSMARWTSLGGKPKRSANAPGSVTSDCASHGEVRSSASHARLTRAGYRVSLPTSSTGMSGKYRVLLATQSAMMSRPVSRISAGMVSCGSSSTLEKPLSCKA